MQTKSKKYSKIIEQLKAETFIEGTTVKQWESILSLYNKYTCDFRRFKDFIEHKIPIAYTLRTFYQHFLLRKLRWNSYINRERSEAKVINLLKQRFGNPSDVLMCIGDHNQGNYHMPGKPPTKGKGLRKMIRKGGFTVLLVPEAYTSVTCYNCFGKNKKWLTRPSRRPRTFGQPILVHGLLRCQSAQECGSIWNRDVNGCLNICMLADMALRGEERPQEFTR